MKLIQESTILVIDDDISNLIIIEALLSPSCSQIILQSNPLLGIELLRKKKIDLILLDIIMPEIDGYKVCLRIKEDPKIKHIPVIFLSSLMRTSDKVKGFEVGAVDYISKPFQAAEMIARIESCLKLHRQLQQTQTFKLNQEQLERYGLTNREFDILNLYIAGYSRKKIAQHYGLTEHTVKWHLGNIYRKLNVSNRAELLAVIQASNLK